MAVPLIVGILQRSEALNWRLPDRDMLDAYPFFGNFEL